MTFLYLDIETIPAQSAKSRLRIASAVKPPAQMKKADTIAAWEKDGKEQAVKDAVDKTSFDGGLGHVCCIGWAVNDEELESESCLTIDEEARRIAVFFNAVGNEIPTGGTVTVVGHYISGFDIRFLTQRAIVLGVWLPSWWPKDPKPWSEGVFDTMTAWAGSKGTISLDNLCFALGMKGKDDIDGSMVAKLFEEGKHDIISNYCRDDVARVRSIHRRMLFAFGDIL